MFSARKINVLLYFTCTIAYLRCSLKTNRIFAQIYSLIRGFDILLGQKTKMLIRKWFFAVIFSPSPIKGNIPSTSWHRAASDIHHCILPLSCHSPLTLSYWKRSSFFSLLPPQDLWLRHHLQGRPAAAVNQS